VKAAAAKLYIPVTVYRGVVNSHRWHEKLPSLNIYQMSDPNCPAPAITSPVTKQPLRLTQPIAVTVANKSIYSLCLCICGGRNVKLRQGCSRARKVSSLYTRSASGPRRLYLVHQSLLGPELLLVSPLPHWPRWNRTSRPSKYVQNNALKLGSCKALSFS